MSFAENLRTARKERQLSQEALAELLHVSRQAVSKWEAGQGYPEAEKLIALAKALEVSLDRLMLDEDEPSKAEAHAVFFSGRILISAYDGSAAVNCMQVRSFRVSKGRGNVPQHVLFGIDAITFLGENRTLLGWYADAESVEKEQAGIAEAMAGGAASYKLQYAAEVIRKRFSVRLAEREPMSDGGGPCLKK